MAEKPRECPFCGKKAIRNMPKYNQVRCSDIECHAGSHGWFYIENWNHRPAESALQSEVERLKKGIKLFGRTISEQSSRCLEKQGEIEGLESENTALRKRVGELEGELKKAGIRLKLNQKLCCDCTHHPPDNPDKEPWGTCRTCNSNHDNWHSKFVPLTPPATGTEASHEEVY